jgi:hypothetical protein
MMDPRKPATAESRSFPPLAVRIGFALLMIGLIVAIAGYVHNPPRAAFSNVLILTFAASIGIGALFLVALEYITGAVWSVPMRRVNEFLAGLIPFLPLLALPLVFHLHDVFQWSRADLVQIDPLLQAKRPYLNTQFLLFRTGVIFGIWIIFYLLFTRISVRQDVTREQKLTRSNVRLSAVFLPIFAVSITVIAVDWLMGLQPHWFSTIFGVYYFSGTVLCALGVTTYVVVSFVEGGLLPKLTRDHMYSLGALMFAFVNFWAYIAFSQFLLIWYANIPEETTWFMSRWQNGWQVFSVLLIVIRFAIPYFVLLPQEAKMDPRRLKYMAVWMVFAHLVDLYWLIMPTQYPVFRIGWVEIGFPLIIIGMLVLLLSWKVKRYNVVPIGDPKLQRGMDFHL